MAHQQQSNNNRDNVKVFTYNVVFEPGATQDDILEYSGIKRIIEMAIEGFSCTAFCYGQTGSGKTHTLTGPPDLVRICIYFTFSLHYEIYFKFLGKPNLTDPRHGLIFRSFVYLFRLIKNRKDFHFILKASFLEIYNERVSFHLILKFVFPIARRSKNKNKKAFFLFFDKKSRVTFQICLAATESHAQLCLLL